MSRQVYAARLVARLAIVVTGCCVSLMPGRLWAEVATSQPAAVASAAHAASQARVIRFLEDRIARDPEDIVALNRLSGEYLRRFRATGDDADLTRAIRAAERSLAVIPAELNKAALAARARSQFALHRFTAARDDARELLRLDPHKRYPLEILGDALLELGDYDEAADAYARMREFGESDPTAEVRLARLAIINGDREAARAHLVAAVELARTTADQSPELFAWSLIRAGHFAFTSGDWAGAEAHYETALHAVPDDWAARDHLAELRAAQRRYEESVEIYEKLASRVPRPEIFQALGDVYALLGRTQDAATWHGKARDGYLAATAAGSAHYYHHLAGFYSDSAADPKEAVRWARKDLEVRHSVYAYDALAWALYRAGDLAAASKAMDTALARGTRDAHMLYHASLIYAGAGDPVRGRECLRRAAETNPKFMAFHVHR